MAVLSLVGLACNFVTMKTKETVWNTQSTSHWNLNAWFENINDMDGYDHIANWQTAKIMLVATVILLLVMAVLLVLKLFIKHPVLKWTTAAFGLVVIMGALTFMLTTFTGCSALSGEVIPRLVTVDFGPNLGVFMFGLGALASAILAEIIVFRQALTTSR